MAIDFTLTEEQRKIQTAAREFAQDVLAPVSQKIDEEPDPLRGFQLAKPAYAEACKRGIAFSMLPKQYGGGGLSNVDFVIAAEEIQAVDPGFGTTVLVNGLGLMPVWYYGTESKRNDLSRPRPPIAAGSSSSDTLPASRPDPRGVPRTSTRPRSTGLACRSRQRSTVTSM
jgi:alkylation response protein AidB-like acyl-CoA dehydrogenase